jgi:outer membrane murein-binding lipoprotein Lpp
MLVSFAFLILLVLVGVVVLGATRLSGGDASAQRIRELEDRVAVLEAEQRELSRLVSDAVIQADEAERFGRLTGESAPHQEVDAGGGGEESRS